jgi:hypothetical protein
MKKKKSLSPYIPLPNIKGKELRHLELHSWAFPFIGFMKFLFSKEFITIFGLG